MLRIPAHLQRNPQSGFFYFRLTVPERLRHIVGRREVKKSLRTGRRSEAVVLAQRLYAQTYELFYKLEFGMGEKPTKAKNALDELANMGSGPVGTIGKTTVPVPVPGAKPHYS